ncbi:hypothetical protein CVT24_012151, partial [Panaeolus cyanescens]
NDTAAQRQDSSDKDNDNDSSDDEDEGNGRPTLRQVVDADENDGDMYVSAADALRANAGRADYDDGFDDAELTTQPGFIINYDEVDDKKARTRATAAGARRGRHWTWQGISRPASALRCICLGRICAPAANLSGAISLLL